ncbi:MAG TPA: Xaa-Pro peptidase family protein [Candidatus Omnitrophota bacterium]|nr:Xaa-Pro peptidase family protein [Candidatus Omnitrophota bacterium]
MRKQNTAELIIASSENDSNMLYATRFFAPDPFIFLKIPPKKFAVMNDLELDRAKSRIKTCEVVSFSELAAKYGRGGTQPFSSADAAAVLLKKYRVNTVEVPVNFPIQYADALRKKGFRITPRPNPFFKQRAIKKRGEIAEITQTLRATEEALSRAISVIKNSDILGGRLYHEGSLLTADIIKRTIHVALIEQDCLPDHTIVAPGVQGSEPHNEGSGPLFADSPIVIDVFPRSMTSHYYADITRTVVRGKASPKLRKMYAAVQGAQEIAFRMIRAGVDGKKVHAAVTKYFEKQGFKTGIRKGRLQGFTHSTGHGLGLDVHESTRISPRSEILKAGNVVTVEPGLYYPDIGGVRLEDLVVVTQNGCRNLTKLGKCLEL